jgi:transposase-like protein
LRITSQTLPGAVNAASALCVFHGKIGFEGYSERGAAMLIHLHKQATTTPKVRAAIQASDAPASVLAERFGTTEQTVYKWRHRDSVHDRSHTPHRLQTTLNLAQEAVAVALRKALLVSLDDLLAVVREFLNPDVSRSGLDRCLRRHGVPLCQGSCPLLYFSSIF